MKLKVTLPNGEKGFRSAAKSFRNRHNEHGR